QKTHLCSELSGLLKAILKFARQRFLKKYDQFPGRQAVLDSAEAENVHARLPCDLFRCATERRYRIRETRTIHVKKQRSLARQITHCTNFIRRINRTKLGRLRNTVD